MVAMTEALAGGRSGRQPTGAPDLPTAETLTRSAARHNLIPIATIAVLTVTAVVSAAQFVWSDLAAALWRDPDRLAAGEVWRLVTPIFLQHDEPFAIVGVLSVVAVLGAIAERLYGSARWLIFYFVAGLTAHLIGNWWQPFDAGCSVAGAGLLGALMVALLGRRREMPPAMIGPVLVFAGATYLCFARDIHGPPILIGAALAWFLPPR
jgi:rhomboid protease GluP